MSYDPANDYKWIEVERGYAMYAPQLRLTLYVLKSKKGWVGVGKFKYDEDNNKFTIKSCERMEDAKHNLINNLVTGLCKCQYDLMASISKQE